MSDKLEACEAVLARYERASISPEIAAMEMLIAAEDASFVLGLARDVARAFAETVRQRPAGPTSSSSHWSRPSPLQAAI